jgi:DHA1 family multidrug resistance protein-like MFS transporter
LVCAPLWGLLSDRIGRKPVLSIGVLGYALALLMFGLATQFWMLFLARVLSGALSSATMPTAMAYIGDNAPEEERSGRMGQLGAAMGVGVVIGPLLGGWLSAGSLSLPFFSGSALAFLSLLLVIAWLPETRAPGGRPGSRTCSQATGESHSTAAGEGAGQPAGWRAFLLTMPRPVAALLLLIFIMSFGLTGFQGMIGLYVVERLSFSTAQVGGLWMVIGVVMIAGQGGLTGPLTARLGEAALIRLGLLGGAAGFGLIVLAQNYPAMLLATAFFVLTLALIGPALNAHISAYAGQKQGAVMGLNSAAASLGRVVGPLWAGWLYDVELLYPFASGMATLVVGYLFCRLALRAPARTNGPPNAAAAQT